MGACVNVKTALVVDDSKVAYLTLSKMLAKRDIVVEGASSGEEALEYLKHKRPDVIFMDVLMPGMDGYEAVHSVVSNPQTSDIPIVMCSSKDSDEDRNKAFSEGAKGFIVKPATEEGLSQALQGIDQLLAEAVAAMQAPTLTEQPSVCEAHIGAAAPAAATAGIDEAALITRLQDLAEDHARTTAERVAAKVADTVASKVATDAAEWVVQDMIRAASERMSQQVGGEVRPMAERIATEVAESVANTVAATTSHAVAAKIAEDVMRENIERLSKEIVTRVAQTVVPEIMAATLETLKKDLEDHAVRLLCDHSEKFLASDTVKNMVTKLVESTAATTAEEAAKKVSKQLAEEVAQKTARRVAEETVSYVAGRAAKKVSLSSRRATIMLGAILSALVFYQVFTALKGFLF
jgi:CheY-like chemotaxis protein